MKTIIKPQRIWDISLVDDRKFTRLEMPDLIRFKGHWFCTFHEGEIHHAHPSGRCRLITSPDGEHWETVTLFDWEGADVREINLSITPEGWLMGNTVFTFVSQNPRTRSMPSGQEDAYTPTDVKSSRDRPNSYYQLDKPGMPATDKEEQVAYQSVTWLSQDGVTWSSVYAPASGINLWRWDVSWHDGMGYSAGYRGSQEEGNGTLFRTRDGKEWRSLAKEFFPEGRGNESALAFGADGTAYCLLRDARLRLHKNESTQGNCVPMLGIGTSPFFTEWEWRELTVDLDGGGDLRPIEKVLVAPLGGPKLIRLSDGRFVAAARVMFTGDSDGYIALFFLNPDTATLVKFADIDGTTYPGIVEHDGQIWVSCANAATSEILLAKVDIPSPG